MSNNSCVVVFSGGQDSTTALFWARKIFKQVYALSFDYGQRHAIELKSAKKICDLYHFPHSILPINTFTALGGNALTDIHVQVDSLSTIQTLPNTFVPGRNLIFMTFAAAWAWKQGITNLVTGVCQTDYSGYPDCRRTTMDALELSISLGMEHSIQIHTPLMDLTKAQSIVLAQEVGALDALAWSHTCYNGQFPPCGQCPACILRSKGFEQAGLPDPLVTRSLTGSV